MLEYSKLPMEKARNNFFTLYLILFPKNTSELENPLLPIEYEKEDYGKDRKI